MDNEQLLQALSDLMDVKLEPIKIEIDGIKDDIGGVKDEMCGIKDEIGLMKTDIGGIKDKIIRIDYRLDKLDSQASALRNGQIETRKEIKEVSIKVSETYSIALDAWGQSTENREWLKSV